MFHVYTSIDDEVENVLYFSILYMFSQYFGKNLSAQRCLGDLGMYTEFRMNGVCIPGEVREITVFETWIVVDRYKQMDKFTCNHIITSEITLLTTRSLDKGSQDLQWIQRESLTNICKGES